MRHTPSFDELTERLRMFRDARDWQRFHSAKNLAMSVAIEAGELLEVFQWTTDNAPPSEEDLARAADELADVQIYLMLLSDKLGINLATATAEKIDRNEQRFPTVKE